MKIKILFAALFLLFGTLIYASENSKNYVNAHWRVYEIESQLIENNLFDSANNAFIEIFNEYDYRFARGISLAAKNLFCNLHKTWNSDSVLIDFYFQKFARSYPFEKLHLFCECADSASSNAIKKRYDFYDSIFIASVDTALIHKVSIMYDRDQRTRTDPNHDHNMLREVDSLNFIELEKILEQYSNFPGVKKLGLHSFINLRMVIHHTEPEQILDKWYNMLMQLIKDGEFDPDEVAGSIDYAIFKNIEIVDGKPATKYLKYGTYDYNDLCIPVKNIEQTNKWRKEIGLPPLEYELKWRRTKYDEAEFRKIMTIIDE